MANDFEFEDGHFYEFRTKIGVLTIVCDIRVVPPLRVYGPDGVEVDPEAVVLSEGENTHGGFLAYDLSGFEKGDK